MSSQKSWNRKVTMNVVSLFAPNISNGVASLIPLLLRFDMELKYNVELRFHNVVVVHKSTIVAGTLILRKKLTRPK